ncbi:MAG: adenylate/guanylate cyclase domain-containing protein, partial [Rhodospirillales bacterium]|nr:adenylate/guanylate cyclase domain-containing protein [Rhodospirillales bacterium]
MTTEQKFLAIMFVDVRGSTRLYELYGDKRGRELTAWSVKIFDHYVSYYGGTVIKTMGDGAMATLPSAEDAVRTAIAVQEAHAQAPVNVGVGFQIGNVLSEGGDVFGDAVNVAARLCSLAKSGEILTTEEAVKRFPPDLRNATRHIDTTTVKGRREEIKIYQVLWNQDEEQTVTIMDGMAPSRQSRRGSIL